MKFLKSRYGGNELTTGKGNSKLLEDQSLDYMLDHYAQQNIPNKKIEYFGNTFIVADHEEDGKNLFINVTEPNGNTILDFSKANDYTVFCYDSKGNLKSRHYAINNRVSFMIQTPYSTIHLVLFNSINKIKEENND